MFRRSNRTPVGHQLGRDLSHEDHRGKRKLLLVRHGQTDFNNQHRLPGQLPGIHLNADGQREAQATAVGLRDVPLTAIIASPLERTMETAQLLNAGHNLEIRTERDLLDTDYGVFSGQDYLELDKTDPRWQRFTTNALYAPPGVESFSQVQRRAVRAAERWRQAPDVGEWVALVTHADLVKMIVAYYAGIPLGRVPLFNIDNASVSLLVFHPEPQMPPHVLCFNWTSPALWLSAIKKGE